SSTLVIDGETVIDRHQFIEDNDGSFRNEYVEVTGLLTAGEHSFAHHYSGFSCLGGCVGWIWMSFVVCEDVEGMEGEMVLSGAGGGFGDSVSTEPISDLVIP
ncbi:MAG: hypothetical protein KC620_14345, partial [Myxococcales bacterium]|nr:hypothetical protein [Myxococcales bacterium]